MEKVTGKEIPKEQEVFREAWELLKRFARIKKDDSTKEWDCLAAGAGMLSQIGKGDPATEELGKGIAMSILKYIEVRSEE